jgi:hypothetical protein
MTPKTMKSSRNPINRAQRKLTMSLVQKIEHSNFRLCLPQQKVLNAIETRISWSLARQSSWRWLRNNSVGCGH